MLHMLFHKVVIDQNVGSTGNYFRTPIAWFGFGAIFGIMSRLIAIETCSFGFPTNVPFGLASF